MEKVKEAQIDKGKTRESGRNVILNSVKYTQVGSKQSFETTDKWFIKNWHQGTKADHIVKSKRGAEGSRWRRAIKHVEPALRGRSLGDEGFGRGFGDNFGMFFEGFRGVPETVSISCFPRKETTGLVTGSRTRRAWTGLARPDWVLRNENG